MNRELVYYDSNNVNVQDLCNDKSLTEILKVLKHGQSYSLKKEKSSEFYLFTHEGQVFYIPTRWFIEPNGNFVLLDSERIQTYNQCYSKFRKILIDEGGNVKIIENLNFKYITSRPLPLYLNDNRERTELDCLLSNDGTQFVVINSLLNTVDNTAIIGFVDRDPFKINLNEPFELIALLSTQSADKWDKPSKVERIFIKKSISHILKIECMGNNFYKFWVIEEYEEGPEQHISFIYVFEF